MTNHNEKVKYPLFSGPIATEYTAQGYGAYLRFHGLEPAVGLHPRLWTADHTTSTTCRYLPAFYTDTKFYCLVAETHADGCEQLAQGCYPTARWLYE